MDREELEALLYHAVGGELNLPISRENPGSQNSFGRHPIALPSSAVGIVMVSSIKEVSSAATL